MSKCIVPAGCANLACDPDHGVCIARQANGSRTRLPGAHALPAPRRHELARRVPRYAPEDARVLHAELSPAEAERKVDESRVVTNTPRAGETPEARRSFTDRFMRKPLDNVKDSNPKDAIGVLKIALTYVSLPVILEVALGMMEGGFKYGRHNYREAGVRASVYVDATFRHLAAFWEGEDFDPDIQEKCGIDVSHVTKAIASLTVLRDSMIRGNWVDDRPPAVKPGWIAKLSGDVKKLAKAYPEPVPPVTELGLRAKHSHDELPAIDRGALPRHDRPHLRWRGRLSQLPQARSGARADRIRRAHGRRC
jgi:hypothetical protein